ncbi:HU family DNA-binding protein [Ciceribacter sp. RN22]|uniref:HU family DNA-binding protein n=1 Tax=Ciceribacter sp. RN22 TaxID=2954932 RepID=UPI002092D108|nr:HU family DNA-binding protein [Ciceribacter sp. RN22]MCO6180996.1 HU family DNA-binding protein [Ciceribacter sp. RN22]
MTTINEIADKIAADHHLTKIDARAIVEDVFAAIAAASASGAETAIRGFGKFKVKQLPERQGWNPATGAAMKVPATTKLTFVPAKNLKDALKK